MRFFEWAKDGGKESTVDGFYVIELKSLFSIIFLKFKNGTREAFHSHAFNALSWIVKGRFEENLLDGRVKVFLPSFKPKYTSRPTFHKVVSVGETWVLTLRGPWADTWREYSPVTKKFTTLTHGRKIVA